MKESLSVFVTQPEINAGGLVAELQAKGFEVRHYPVFSIKWLNPTPRLEPQFVIATSPNAVTGALKASLQLPQSHCQYFAVGRASAQALNQAGIKAVSYPEQAGSDGLVLMPNFKQLAGQHGWLLTGEGGRALIEQQLNSLNAALERVNCYQRQASNQLDKLQHALQSPAPTVAIATSKQTLDNLEHMADAESRKKLAQCHWLVSSERIAAQLLSIWPEARYSLATGPEPEALLAACQAWTQH